MGYVPDPIDTSSVRLSEDIRKLSEKLAENAHDLWAAGRIAQGWRFGPKRDDGKKEHPCLVAYEDLPESEKEFDRSASLGTLKAILALGYRIEKP